MSTLKPKNWVFLIPEDAAATIILYAPLHKIAVRVSPQAGDLLVPILDGRQEDVTDSPQKDELMGFLASNNLLELPKGWAPEQSKAGKGKAKITMSLTNKCNLRCIYCYAKTGMDYTTMTWEVAKDAIDSVIGEAVQNCEKKFGITFHGGGEATVELKFLRRCVAYIQEQARVHNLKPSLGMVTNMDGKTLFQRNRVF
jgi:sulfatase maturation enzyme AslB (radical SAM superfamily)